MKPKGTYILSDKKKVDRCITVRSFESCWLTMEGGGEIKRSSDMTVEQWGGSDYRRYEDDNGDRYMKLVDIDNDYQLRAYLIRQGSVKVESL